MRLNLIRVPHRFLAPLVLLLAGLLALAAAACGGDDGADTSAPTATSAPAATTATQAQPATTTAPSGSAGTPAAATRSNARAHHGP